MRVLTAALLLSASVPCFCQTAVQHPVDPDQIFRLPDRFQQPLRNFGKPPSFAVPLWITPPPHVVIPTQTPRIGNPQPDTLIVRKPPPNSFAHQEPRTPLAASIYPDLRLLPVESARPDVTSTE